MEFTFRLTGFHSPQTLRIRDEALDILDEAKQCQQSIPWHSVRKLQEYDGLSTVDPDRGPFDSKYCRVFAKGVTVSFRNGYHLYPSGKMGETATNLTTEYDAFLRELVRSIAAVKPDTPITSGWLLASLAWWGVALLGVGCLAMAVGAFFYDDWLTALGLSLFFIPVGGMTVFAGSVFGLGYWPKRTTVAARAAAQHP
jgi:hypothetical protein